MADGASKQKVRFSRAWIIAAAARLGHLYRA